MSRFASPYVFRATAVDGENDPWIAPGIHLRIHASPLLGPPLAPFVIWPLREQQDPETLDTRWVREDGTEVPAGPVDLAQEGTVLGAPLHNFAEPMPDGWCFLEVEADDEQRIEWLAPAVRPWGVPVLGARDGRRPYAFGGTGLGQIRAGGSGAIFEVRGIHENWINLEGLGEPALLSLPIEGSPWYANQGVLDPFGEAQVRLDRGQRLRLGPPDSPDGAFPALGGGEDLNRVFDHLAPDQLDEWLGETFMTQDPPGSVIRDFPSDDPDRRATARVQSWDVIHTMAADPVIARYLGFGTVVDPIHQDEGRPQFWLVAGQFVVSSVVRERLIKGGLFLERLGDETDSRVSDLMAAMFPLPAVHERYAGHSKAPDGGKWVVVTLYTLAVAVALAPPDPPPPPAVRHARSAWNGGEGLGTWRQTLALPGQPPAGSLGFARVEASAPVSLHVELPGYGAAVLLANWSRTVPDPATGIETALLGAGGGPLWTPPTVTDSRLPDGMDPGEWLLWQSDEFGRWSEAAGLALPAPPRPVAPAPAPELYFTPLPAAGDASASPGRLDIRVELPAPEALPPGARPISGLDITIDGAPQPRQNAAGLQQVVFSAAAGSTMPGGSHMIEVSARFVHTDGRVSLPGSARREVFDPRPLVPNPTAPALVWTGRLDPTGQAELSVTWPAANLTTGYRVYLGDERRLANALLIPQGVLDGTAQDPPHRLQRTRALAADKICEADRAQQFADKGQFTLLNETPQKADGDGVVRFRCRLPGGLRGVQFLRIVPVTPAGVEAPFGKCGLVPTAVPLEERPPAPAVEVRASPAGVHVRILAFGLDAPTLSRFGYPGSGQAPQYRVRRGRGGVQDPVYMPVWKEGDLQPPPMGAPAGTPWSAEFLDDEADTPAFVRHTWTAEIRFPPEPVQAEAIADPGPLAVRPLFGPFAQDAQSRWSAPSLPASAVRVPANAPAAPGTLAAAQQGDGTVKLNVSDLPAAHPKILAPYQVAVWKQVAGVDGPRLSGEPPVLLAVPPGVQPVEHVDAAGDAVAFSVALVDPLGRLGAAGVVAVTNP